MSRATLNRTLIASARVGEAELAEWRAKAAADAHLDGRSRRSGAGAHPGAGADRLEPEPDRPLGEAKAAFQVEIEEQRRTVERLKETTWGVVLVCDPAGEHPLQKNPLLTMDRRPTVRLSSE